MSDEIKTRPNSREFSDGYDRIFGADRRPARGRWVYDERLQKLVRAEDYQPPEMALNAPILAGRFYENTTSTDGTDIGSRAKHREYMRANNLTTTDDYKQTWAAAAKEREAVRRGETGHGTRDRRADLARALEKLRKP